MATKKIKITLELSESTHNDLLAVVDNCNRAHDARDAVTSHGKLVIPTLLLMLAEDAGMTNSRPGSWEGANMQKVLDSHGYC